MEEPTLEFVSTPDQWKLALYHYPNRSSKKHPVLLVHGLGTNRFDVDFPMRHLSLARYLHNHGYDTWVVELRGAGKSHKKGIFPNWDFDDYITQDLPALVAHIQKVTRKKSLHWVGHSLGGTLIYAALETMGQSVCASAATLGSAMSATTKHGLIKLLLKVDPIVARLPHVPLKNLARIGVPLSRWIAPIEDNFFYVIDNLDMETITTALRIAVENVSTPLFLQLHDWYKNNHFRSRDGSFSYRDNLKKIKSPLLVCAGSMDGLTAYPDVHFAYRMIGSQDKKFRVFGREHGCRTEYGHLDLILGKNAPREVFPAVAEWFDRHDK